MTEHAAVIFVFFFLAEYSSIVLICILTSILFLGGYLIDITIILYLLNSILFIINKTFETSLFLATYFLLTSFTLLELISEWFIEVIHLGEYMLYTLFSVFFKGWEVPMFYETKFYEFLMLIHLEFFSWINLVLNNPLTPNSFSVTMINISSIDTQFNTNSIAIPNSILGTISTGLFSSLILGFKTCLMIFTFIWARASFPRIRFDQLMSFCWTVLLPIVVAFIVLIPCILYGFDILPTNLNLL